MSFIEELQRRNVIKVGVAYSVVGWLAAQVAEFATENFGAPEWALKTFVVFLLLGLPVVLIFAWAFEMTPEGIKREKDVDRSQSITGKTGQKLNHMIIGILVVAVGYLLVDKLVIQKGSEPFSVETASQTVNKEDGKRGLTPDEGPSVAVLPFVNMSDDASNEYFSDGLTETLLHMLAQLPELRVAARTSSFAFKGQNTDVSEIARTLGVAHILEGSVQKANDRVRVTAQLIRAADGFHVWSQNYTRPLEDIFAIQDEIAGDVASALGSSLLSGSAVSLANVSTKNVSAYDSYLKGLEQQAVFSYTSLPVAENHFKQALIADSGFTDARLALVRNFMFKYGTGLINEEEARSAIEPLFAQIREADPDNRLARALELTFEFQAFRPDMGAEKTRIMIDELRELLLYVPAESFSRARVAGMLNGFFHEPEEAIEVVQAGLMIDPLEPELHRMMGAIYSDMERLDDALSSMMRAMELAPDNPNTYGDLSDIEKDRNNLPEALEWLRRASEVDPNDHEIAFLIASDLFQLGLPEEGEPWYSRVQTLAPGSAVARLAELERALARDEREQALELSRRMIIDQVDSRMGAFGIAVFFYTDLMLERGQAKEAFDFLVSVRPEITTYDSLPSDFKALSMQRNSFVLMLAFESLESVQAKWRTLTNTLDEKGIPWLAEADDNAHNWNYIFTGEYQKAADNYLKYQTNMPMARNLTRHMRYLARPFGPIFDDPRVAVRVSELDVEFEQLREEIRELMLQPEWN